MRDRLLLVLAVAAASACRYAAMLGLSRSIGRRPLLAGLCGGAWAALLLVLALVLAMAGRREPGLLAWGGAAALVPPLALAAWALARGLARGPAQCQAHGAASGRRAGSGREGSA